MNNTNDIHYNDAKVERKTVTGWVDKNGRFWGEDEHMARWCSSTVNDCATDGCSNLVRIKGSMICDTCSEVRDNKKWHDSEKRYDLTSMIYSEKLDMYFDNVDEMMGRIKDGDIKVKDLSELRLYICKPNYPETIDMESIQEEFLAEGVYCDDVLDEDVLELLKTLNSKLKAHKAISHSPTDIGLDVSTLSIMNMFDGLVGLLSGGKQ